ncbi:uncharacterized protein LOC118022534 [Mirounga leonina]|uniref:uncharacterized protein LOC118022534 n=1 Tax=Mirounga leonina TaxID=9715 RepID=UPI00156C36B0|nr:uncharacterized protein LOC118022534 [Mirounga leonina]
MDELNQVPEIYITMPPKTFPSACPTPVNAIPMDYTSIVYFMSLSLNDVTLLQNVLKLLLLPPPRAPYAPTQWPSDPKRALEGPKGKPSGVRSDRAGQPAPRGRAREPLGAGAALLSRRPLRPSALRHRTAPRTAAGSRGGELDPRRTTEKRRTIAPRTNPGHARRGVGAQGAGAPLTGRSRRSNEKVKRVQMLLPTIGNSFNRCQFTSWVLRVQIQKPAGGVCVVRSGSGQKLYRKRTQWVTNETQSLSPVSRFPDPSLFDHDPSHSCLYERVPLGYSFFVEKPSANALSPSS